tara:strand:- start:10882 stop:11199 length:318 start_codon:yes stop_codon:yes gene_type:complete
MNNYINADVNKLANVYFDGRVISRNIFLKDGSKKTLGIMLIGEYEFKTVLREEMEINSGNLYFKAEGVDDWQFIKEGMNFNIPKNSSFKVRVKDLVNYTCSYFEE